MQVIHVHSEGSEYHVVRVAKEQSPELVFCESPEELVGVLRGLGVAQPGVNYVLRQLEVGTDAMVSGEREGAAGGVVISSRVIIPAPLALTPNPPLLEKRATPGTVRS